MNDYLSDVFGVGGLLSARFPGYEPRSGQVALARMVDAAMRGGPVHILKVAFERSVRGDRWRSDSI